MLAALLTGLGVGLAAGVSPGPLLFLVVTATLSGRLRDGLAVAAAPLISDVVVVTVTLATLGSLPSAWLSWLELAGAAVVAFIGVQTLREGRRASLPAAGEASAPPLRTALRRAVLVNLTSPHPWLTWAAVLGPLTVSAWRTDPPAAVAVVAGFYATLVGSKAVLALIVHRGRRRLGAAGYRGVVVGAGLILIGLAVVMVARLALTP